MILVVGGAGYIGSHMNKLLSEKGFKTVVFDNFSTGHREFVKWGELFEGDLSSEKDIDSVFKKYNIKAVMHFAASIIAPESVEDPLKYYTNNVRNTIQLLNAVLKYKVKRMIFSSTAAVYGDPEYTPIDEKHPTNPINPYGSTKLMIETILSDMSNAYNFSYVALRYFNAAGADPESEIGYHSESHLIPLVLDAAIGRRDEINICGTDYDTRDGSCIRDYIHVNDLASAHLLALDYLKKGGKSTSLNLGGGTGFSVREVINSAKRVTKKEFKVVEAERRPGDPPILIADSSKAKNILGWKPQYTNIDDIIKTAWKWHRKQFKNS